MTCPICDQKFFNCDCTALEQTQHQEIQDLEALIPLWVSVIDSLPEPDVTVLVVSPEGVSTAVYRDGVWIHECDNTDHMCGRGAISATHWMPLPDPPQ